MAQLKNPPLIEALVEIQWELMAETPMGKYDPYYQLLLGMLYDSIKSKFPYHEPLSTSIVPDDVTGAAIKHRFRVEKDKWPLVQIGPGMLTVNETQSYKTFETFKPTAVEVMNFLFKSHPQPGNLKITNMKLRYIDAVEFDYTVNNVYDFISDKMHISVTPPETLLTDKIEKLPVSYTLKTSLRCNEPPGTATFTIQTGHKESKRAIIWNQILHASGSDVPNMPDDFEKWMVDAHNVLSKWFEGVIEGPLKGEFNA